MTRPIKFRCWDKNLKRWLSADDMPVVPTGDWVNILSLDADWCEFGQFTGLMDRKGKEIWEGDIVKVVSKLVGFASGIPTEGIDTSFYVVVWVDDYCRFTTKRMDGHVENGFGLRKEHSEKWFEVIGNIHEHGPLLKGGNS